MVVDLRDAKKTRVWTSAQITTVMSKLDLLELSMYPFSTAYFVVNIFCITFCGVFGNLSCGASLNSI
jgi:hypothetical protein